MDEKIVKKEEINEEIDEKEIEKKHSKLLRNVLITLSMVFLLIVAIVLVGKSATKFTYEGVKFEMVKEGNLMFYRTELPTTYQGKLTGYSFYLRNNAKELEVPFKGELRLKSNAVLNMEEDFNCEGKGVIAVANLIKLYKFLEINVMSDKNATCDSESRYTFIQILNGEETKIEQVGESCYNLYVYDCEILEVTEKLMIETFVKVNEANETD